MRSKGEQMSLFDIYQGVEDALENDQPELFRLLDEHIDWYEIIYGKCVYVYPDKNLRLYPGISRDDSDFFAIYKNRTAVERTISSFKHSLCIHGRKTSNSINTKADLFLAGISQLLCVLLADKIHRPDLARRARLLLAA